VLFFFFFPSNILEEFREIKLSTIFEIFSGFLDDGSDFYAINEEGKQINLTMLRMASFDPVKKVLMGKEEIEQNLEKINLLRSRKKNSNESLDTNTFNAHLKRKEIPFNKILSPDDYLICIRKVNEQPIVGYSLIDSVIDLQPDSIGPVIIPHHFFCLRPRKDIGHIHIPFFHLFIDTLIENEIIPLINSGDKRLLKIKFLNELKVTFPVHYEAQKEIFEKYKLLFVERNKAENEISNLKGTLTKEFKNINGFK